jgi:zinc protease
VSGALLPTQDPFLYTLSATATEGVSPDSVESAALEALDQVRLSGVRDAELAKAKAQLRARLVFDNDSVTNIAHQLGYFETIASVAVFDEAPAQIAAVTLDEVNAAARRTFAADNRTVGWFLPNADQPAGSQARA